MTAPERAIAPSGSPSPRRRQGAANIVLRVILAADAAVFLVAAALNLGLQVPLGVTTLAFPSPICQAAIGEAVIGLALVVAGRTGRSAHALLALVAASCGIAFGLLSPRVVGTARDIHLLLVPLTLAGLGVLATAWATGEGLSSGSNGPWSRSLSAPRSERMIAALMALTAASFAAASLVHSGLVVPLGSWTIRDPFPGAAVPEAVIALLLFGGAVALAAAVRNAWQGALGATLFGTILTLYGLSITVGSARPGDVTYHVTVLALLVLVLGLLLLPSVRRHAMTHGGRGEAARG